MVKLQERKHQCQSTKQKVLMFNGKQNPSEIPMEIRQMGEKEGLSIPSACDNVNKSSHHSCR